jgi:protein-S-isoprenylcysteine O-methyltransferase Ste14
VVPYADMKVDLRLLATQIAGMFVVFALALFASAGTVAWWQGWAFLILFFGFIVTLSLWLLASDPGLLTERMTGVGKSDQKAWDRAFFPVAMALFLTWLVVMPLDAVRFHWSRMPDVLNAIGVVVLLSSFYWLFLTYRENSYLSPAVRIQTERRQRVVDTGPYRYVRHPMYAAAGVMMIGGTLLLGSWYGFFAVAALVIAMALRTRLEERTLRAELRNYDAYMARVRWRFVPYIW